MGKNSKKRRPRGRKWDRRGFQAFAAEVVLWAKKGTSVELGIPGTKP